MERKAGSGSPNTSSPASSSQISQQKDQISPRLPPPQRRQQQTPLSDEGPPHPNSHVNAQLGAPQRESPQNSDINDEPYARRPRRLTHDSDDLFDVDDTTGGDNTSHESSEYSEYSTGQASTRIVSPPQQRPSTPYSGTDARDYGATGQAMGVGQDGQSATPSKAVYGISMEAVANALQLPAHTLSVSLSRSNKLMALSKQQQQQQHQQPAQTAVETHSTSPRPLSAASMDISSPITVHQSPVAAKRSSLLAPVQSPSIASAGRQGTPVHMSFVQRVGSALRTPQFTSHHTKLRAGITSPISSSFRDDILPEFNLGGSKKDSTGRFDGGTQGSISPVSSRVDNPIVSQISLISTTSHSSSPVQFTTSPRAAQGSVQRKVGFLSVSSRPTRSGADDFIVFESQSQRGRPDSIMSYGSASPTSVSRSPAAGDVSSSSPSRLREFVSRTHDSATMFGRSGAYADDAASIATASDAGDSLLGSEYSRDRRTMSTSAKSVHSDLHEPLLGSEHSRSGTPIKPKPKKKAKRVHFPDNVINSVSVIQAEEQLSLLVTFHRPWYAHGVFLLASAFFVLSWCFLTRSCVTSTENTPVAVATLACATFGSASLYLVIYLIIVWRPDDDEREFLVSCPENRRVVYAWTSGVVALLSLVGSYAIHVNGASLVSFMCTPLITTYLYEEVKKHSVSFIDAVGSVLVLGGLVVLTIGEDWVTTKPIIESVAVVAVTLIGGIAMSIFLFQTRSVSQHISNFFILTSTMMAATMILFAVAYPLGGLDVPIGKMKKPITNLSKTDFFNLCMSGMFLFLSWFSHHFGSLYFDRMTVAGGFSIGAPLAIISFALFKLPHAELPFEISGGIAVTVGCLCVLVSGWKFRQNVEVRIALEAE